MFYIIDIILDFNKISGHYVPRTTRGLSEWRPAVDEMLTTSRWVSVIVV